MQSNTPLLVANWKMNLKLSASVALAKEFAEVSKGYPKVESWIAPSYTSLLSVMEATKSSSIRCGAQNAYPKENGAFTGEISIPMLKEVGASFTITGHSERRNLFGEKNSLVVERTIGALDMGFNTILCVGENLEEREAGNTLDTISNQLNDILDAFKPEWEELLIIAYEPVWAIGTGRVANTEQISEVHNFIDSLLSGKNCRILYGGSVSPENFKDIKSLKNVSGALVGNASLSSEKWQALLQIASESCGCA